MAMMYHGHLNMNMFMMIMMMATTLRMRSLSYIMKCQCRDYLFFSVMPLLDKHFKYFNKQQPLVDYANLPIGGKHFDSAKSL